MSEIAPIQEVPISDVDPSLAPQSSVEVLFDALDPLVQDFGTAVRRGAQIARQALDPATLEALREKDCIASDLDPNNRRIHRSYTALTGKQKEDVFAGMLSARYNAQILAYSDDEVIRAQVLRHEAEASSALLTNGHDMIPTTRHVYAYSKDMFVNEQAMIKAEQEIETLLTSFLDGSPTAVLEFLEHVQSDGFDTDEYRPLLQLLAARAYDPNASDIVAKYLAELGDPSLTSHIFIAQLDACFNGSETEQEAAKALQDPGLLSWFEFIQDSIESATGKKLLPSDVLAMQPEERWPASLREHFETKHGELLATTSTTYREFIRKYSNKRLYRIPEDQVRASKYGKTHFESATSKKAAKSSRTKRTARPPQIQDVLDIEPKARQIEVVSLLGSSIRGYVRTVELALPDESEAATIEMLGLLDPVERYRKSMGNDPRLTDDVVDMMLSLLVEPRGNGAIKTSMRISLDNGNRHNSATPVWHLNPNNRSGLPIGDLARDTRINYALIPAQVGGRALALLDIGHKNTMAKITSAFRRC